MRTVAFANTKGGVGKSTAAINIAVCAAVRGGESVLLVDTDRQASSIQWSQLRDRPGVDTISARPHDLGAALAKARMRYSLSIVDTAGHDLRAALATAGCVDLTVIVARPTVLDVRVAMRMRECLDRRGADYALLLSQVPVRLSERLTFWTDSYQRLGTVISPPWAYLYDFQDSAALGMGVVEYRPTGGAAIQVTKTYEWIVNRMERLHAPGFRSF